MEKLVDIKIRKQYRDILKDHCKENGLKMYICVERLIESNCKKKTMLPSKSVIFSNENK